MTAKHWRDLKVGDRVRFLQIPQGSLPEETLQLYTTLVTQRLEVSVHEIDQWGHPVIEYCANDRPGEQDYHWLSIDDTDHWEQIERS